MSESQAICIGRWQTALHIFLFSLFCPPPPLPPQHPRGPHTCLLGEPREKQAQRWEAGRPGGPELKRASKRLGLGRVLDWWGGGDLQTFPQASAPSTSTPAPQAALSAQ